MYNYDINTSCTTCIDDNLDLDEFCIQCKDRDGIDGDYLDPKDCTKCNNENMDAERNCKFINDADICKKDMNNSCVWEHGSCKVKKIKNVKP